MTYYQNSIYNIIVTKNGELDKFSPGTLKGNRIQNEDNEAYPIDYNDDRHYIADNFGPFLLLDRGVDNNATETMLENYMFSTSNYQFMVGDASGSAQANDNTDDSATL